MTNSPDSNCNRSEASRFSTIWLKRDYPLFPVHLIGYSSLPVYPHTFWSLINNQNGESFCACAIVRSIVMRLEVAYTLLTLLALMVFGGIAAFMRHRRREHNRIWHHQSRRD